MENSAITSRGEIVYNINEQFIQHMQLFNIENFDAEIEEIEEKLDIKTNLGLWRMASRDLCLLENSTSNSKGFEYEPNTDYTTNMGYDSLYTTLVKRYLYFNSFDYSDFERPSNWAIKTSLNLIAVLEYKDITSYKLLPTAEGGLALVFVNGIKRLIVEIYNNKELGYIIEDTKKKSLLENEDLKSILEAYNRILKFLN